MQDFYPGVQPQIEDHIQTSTLPTQDTLQLNGRYLAVQPQPLSEPYAQH
jgi:hypothetical protein